MKSKLLILALACAAAASAQSSNSNNTQTSSTAREIATGKASGKSAPAQGGQTNREGSAASVSEIVVTKPGANGRESSAPSVSEVTAQAPSDNISGNHKKGWDPEPKRDIVGKAQKPSNDQPRVATGDVNGDGRADVTATTPTTNNGQNSNAINNSHSNIKQPRDLATGQASGKRQHEPVTIRKEVDAASPSLAK